MKSQTLITPDDRLQVRIEEAAELLGYGRSTVFRMIARGELPVVRNGRTSRIPRVALDQWISDRMDRAGRPA